MESDASTLSVAKITDDLLLAGTREFIQKLSNSLSNRFSVRKTIIDETILFNGCRIRKERDGSVTLDMQQYLSDISYLVADKLRRKEWESLVTKSEMTDY